MTTYNTYQEAKIANPDSEIVTTGKNWVGDEELKGKFEALNSDPDETHILSDDSWVKCNPADYCMTVEKFLANGHEFVEGDIYMFSDGFVDVVERPENKPAMGDSSRYILRAAALEEKELLSKIADVNVEHYKKPRTKVEYVEVTDSIFDLRPDFEAGELYFRWLGNGSGAGYDKITTEKMLFCRYEEGRLLRRIETPMTEREAFIDAAIECIDDYNSDDPNYFKQWFESMFDSGKFKLVN